MVEETYDLSKGIVGIIGTGIDEANIKCQSSNSNFEIKVKAEVEAKLKKLKF